MIEGICLTHALKVSHWNGQGSETQILRVFLSHQAQYLGVVHCFLAQHGEPVLDSVASK